MANKNPNWVDEFESKGYAVIEDFSTSEECDEMKAEMYRVLNELEITAEHMAVFSSSDEEKFEASKWDYFFKSAGKVRYFFEKDALKEDGTLTVPKDRSICKVALALHWHNEVFKRFSFSNKMKSLAHDLGYKKPAVVESVYLFNNPGSGAHDHHQDGGTFWMEPMKLCGLFLALDDADEKTGCMWFIPESHRESKPELPMIKQEDDNGVISLKPGDYRFYADTSKFTPCPAKKGSLVLIHGLVVHKNNNNETNEPKNAYTMHLVEQEGTTWSPDNWLQSTEELPFNPLYSN
ncbi:phytanoyl-CoA dioxygenase domain-containing protein 1-like [Watersipora subatra]|uniref:phytanoyl-CoA dioxygenase domain-containing protein 1-like n=1 Tax=Watersipora subatra TaxID=2589382 RepID=UPI00355B44A6